MTKAEMKRCVQALSEMTQEYTPYPELAYKYKVKMEDIDGWNPRFLWCLDALKKKWPGFTSIDDLSGGKVEASMLLSEACA